VPPQDRARARFGEPSSPPRDARAVAELRQEATQRVDDFVAGKTELGPLARWVSANARRVNAGGDDVTRELVAKARSTIEAFLHGRVTDRGARDHLARLLAPERRDD
jgi:hypothetical protein